MLFSLPVAIDSAGVIPPDDRPKALALDYQEEALQLQRALLPSNGPLMALNIAP